MAVLLLLGGSLAAAAEATETGLRFRILLADSASRDIAALGLETPLTGRVYVIVSRNDEREPRAQINLNGVPFWGLDVRGLACGGTVLLDETDPSFRGFPLDRVADLPAGEYFVQAFLNVYTTFRRADGHTLEMHLNSGAGQSPWRAPGNAHGAVQRLALDPTGSGTIELTIDTVIPPIEPLEEGDVLQQGNPADTERVKFVKIESERLSRFWGRPMYIGANLLLPEGYGDDPEMRYPALYLQGHYPGRRAPLGFSESEQRQPRSAELTEFWKSDAAPRMIAVSIRDANPYYDTAYSVNSANVGPYGDAITEELIPFLEREFRMIAEPWARVLAGGSTGGWEALAMQIFYPDRFGGAWGWCPDSVDFRYHQIVDVYEDANAYFRRNEWHAVERPNRRNVDGNVTSTVRQENRMEQATGLRGRSAGQWAIWEAVYGPVAADGYPRPVWDPLSGAIDHETAADWREHFDLHQILRGRWETLGPKLAGKLHVAVGEMDSYYLNNAVSLLDEFLGNVDNPPAAASFEYGRGEPHCWIGESPSRPGEEISMAEFVLVVADYLRRQAPEGADLRWLPGS